MDPECFVLPKLNRLNPNNYSHKGGREEKEKQASNLYDRATFLFLPASFRRLRHRHSNLRDPNDHNDRVEDIEPVLEELSLFGSELHEDLQCEQDRKDHICNS